MTTDYNEFLKDKSFAFPGVGFEAGNLNDNLFPFQETITRWALRKGRACMFEDCGLGKTVQQLSWADAVCKETGGNVLVVAPLCVSKQTVKEGEKFGIEVHHTRTHMDCKPGINITNYQMLHHFDERDFEGVVIDESSILKDFSGKIRTEIIEKFTETKYRLACTATPCPNDISELANHAEFLGIMTRAEFLSTWFVHDDEWRIKGHAQKDFWKWLASWAIVIRKPSDIGFSDEGFNLPELRIIDRIIQTDLPTPGSLFNMGLKGITDRSRVRKATVEQRVAAIAEEVNSNGAQWITWCGLNSESGLLEKQIHDSVAVSGADPIEKKEEMLLAFQNRELKCLITKPSIAGHGMNFQNCHKMAFVGLSDSYEQYYQSIRRCYRFGQDHPVTAMIVVSDLESEIVANVRNKEKEVSNMMDEVVQHVKEYEKSELTQTQKETDDYKAGVAEGKDWKIYLGDSCERMKEIESDSIGLSVYSPPFSKLYTYSNSPRDLGNSKDDDEFFGHFRFIIEQLLRITQPGRLTCCHVAQIPAMVQRDGFMGLHDFRGQTIEAFKAGGWTHWGEAVIQKNPQAQAIRTKAHALMFKTLKKDAAQVRPGIADYILVFKKPGENKNPIKKPIGNEEWIEWAHPIWHGISESDTLQFRRAREEEDEAHICPLQLGTIERCIRLWSNEGDTVFTPFCGIGSEVYQAVKMGRKGIGCELKESYWRQAVKNLKSLEEDMGQRSLFDDSLGGE